MSETTTTGAAGATHIVNTPLTVAATSREEPDLLLADIDARLVKVRPMATPLDQISRLGGARNAKSMEVDYYSVDSLPGQTEVSDAVSAGTTATATVKVANAEIFSPTDTIMAVTSGAVFYVEEVADGSLKLRYISADADAVFPALAKGQKLVRMARAAAELDVQTPQSQILPRKSRNYCQIFKAQVEQSVLQRLSAKEVGLTLSDQEEMALMEMRLGIEKSYLFGRMARFDKGLSHGEVFFTQGIWSQAGGEFLYTGDAFTSQLLIELSRKAFTGNAGSSRKVLVGGSGLIQALSRITVEKVVGATQTVTRWGIDFREIHTNFGTLYVVLSEVFDLCGHADDGMVIDPEYLQKYVHIPFRATPLDLRSSGQRNTDALVLTEASCLVLRYPDAHLRITKKATGQTPGITL